MHHGKTIAGRLTPAVPSAIATIAVRGPKAVETILSVASLKVDELRSSRVHFGTMQLAPSAAQTMEEQIVVCRTGSDEVELHCHGGQAVCKAILGVLESQGCILVESGNWPTEHACPISAAAELDLLQAATDKAAAVLVDQLEGALRQRIDEILRLISEPNIEQALVELESLWNWRELGLHLVAPWKVVFAGPPNVGKSSLMNAIVGQTRSIVHHEPGTTRDWIESEIALNGWPLALTDTAGVRSSEDTVEGQGVELALERVAAAELLVFVVDAQVGWTETHAEMLKLSGGRHLVAWNKSDLGFPIPEAISSLSTFVACSTVGKPGIEELLQRISKTLVPTEPACKEAVPFRAGQVRQLESAMDSLRKGDAQTARKELERLTTSWSMEQESA